MILAQGDRDLIEARLVEFRYEVQFSILDLTKIQFFLGKIKD